MTLYLKTINLQSKISSNYLQTKAQNEPHVMEVDKYLADTRVKSMKEYEEKMKYKIKPLPGPSAKPPDQVTPEQEEEEKEEPPKPPGL